jgi:hypothetical protein
MPSYRKCYTDISTYTNLADLTTIDVSGLQTGAEVYIVGIGFYKLFKNSSSLPVDGTHVVRASNDIGIWVSESPADFDFPTPPECQYNPSLEMYLNGSTYEVAPEQFPLTPSFSGNFIASKGSITQNVTGVSLYIYDSRFLSTHAFICQPASLMSMFKSYKTVQLFDNYALIEFVEAPGLITLNYFTVAPPTP